MEKKQKNGAARGGNIALGVACLAIIVLPLFGWFIAGPLLLAAFICSIVAIAQNAARQGIVLMFGSILMPIIAQLVGIAMWAGIGAAGSNEAKKQQQTPQAVSAAYNTMQTQPAPLLAASASAQNLEAQCREIAKREYPTDSQMQRFTYEQQLSAARYMSSAASDEESRAIALREYGEDFAMQKFTYDQQLSAKRYMAKVADASVKTIAVHEYPEDFAMQKFTYDQQLSAKTYMADPEDAEIKKIALREYPNDFAMQKFTYDQQLAAKVYMQSVAADAAKQQAVREYPNDFAMQKFTYDRLAQD